MGSCKPKSETSSKTVRTFFCAILRNFPFLFRSVFDFIFSSDLVDLGGETSTRGDGNSCDSNVGDGGGNGIRCASDVSDGGGDRNGCDGDERKACSTSLRKPRSGFSNPDLERKKGEERL
ncbi:hypothetical protein SLEP1_g12691 [Rubroshorea leprosula]|uniref:Uncharacterized protein n=1 Tax=Rubroshorea leprosula TaxID=152421 RepID=A0AAV5IJ30_9ROSI|nr:hypothetical protein SLEP1_g12691 [Rubroshorea leprosula]